jgi:hypothetical protein
MRIFIPLLLERCARAFFAAALSTLAAGMAVNDFTVSGLRALAVGAGAAGISACLSLISQITGDANSTSFTKIEVGP